jgi:hypothetical protein
VVLLHSLCFKFADLLKIELRDHRPQLLQFSLQSLVSNGHSILGQPVVQRKPLLYFYGLFQKLTLSVPESLRNNADLLILEGYFLLHNGNLLPVQPLLTRQFTIGLIQFKLQFYIRRLYIIDMAIQLLNRLAQLQLPPHVIPQPVQFSPQSYLLLFHLPFLSLQIVCHRPQLLNLLGKDGDALLEINAAYAEFFAFLTYKFQTGTRFCMVRTDYNELVSQSAIFLCKDTDLSVLIGVS